ncbi:MAG: PQQ-dependent sugar dehydrogenase [Cyclobacteriaceae bacterium]
MKRLVYLSVFIVACTSNEVDRSILTEDQKRQVDYAESSFDVANDLNLKLFASEPMVVNPTSMDIDHRGRVWVCEGVNYRLPLNPDKDKKPEGDRIVILEDEDGDGVADKSTVFYQGLDVNAALGIAVLGNKVIVSKSPNVLVLTDEDGDDVADKKEILFSGMNGIESDHGVHSFVFGPDGRVYFNVGNNVNQIMDANGDPVVDKAGNIVNDQLKPYQQGMIFRCNIDGSDFETLAWNFRNPYELAVDAYGNIWQSDNDDDGNRGTRINCVIEFGNYGYRDEMSGAGWREKRTGMHEEIPLRHWHLRDPGVVPNMLQTYAGSPTGIILYEGELLPERFRSQVIHTDAGPNILRAYPRTKQGAGYNAIIDTLAFANDDPWFRPSDVAVAPDGSLFVTDWYDPGVGGHLLGDQAQGRIFRVAPSTKSYSTPNFDFESIEGLITAIKSPNVAVRYLAHQGLREQGQSANDALQELSNSQNPIYQARALWLISELDAQQAIGKAMSSDSEDIRIMALRMAKKHGDDLLIDVADKMKNDPSIQVRREVAVSLRFLEGVRAVMIWTELAQQYKGDRWYLEALGIGADLKANLCFDRWLEMVGADWDKGANKDIVWRMRADKAVALLGSLIKSSENIEATYRYFRALDFHQSGNRNNVLAGLLGDSPHDKGQTRQLVFNHLDRDYVQANGDLKAQLIQLTDSYRGTEDFIRSIQRYKLNEYDDELFDIMMADPNSGDGRNAARILFNKDQNSLVGVLKAGDEQQKSTILIALGTIGSNESLNYLQEFMLNESNPLKLRKMATNKFARGWEGENRMLELLAEGKIPDALKQSAAGAMFSAWRGNIRAEAAKYLKMPGTKDGEELPPISELVELEGDAINGAKVYKTVCTACHVVNGSGIDFGPGLSEIGSKLSKEALFAAILQPDAGINFGYEGYMVTLKDGTKLTGLIQSRTETEFTLKQMGNASTTYTLADVASIEQLESSLMTANLQMIMTKQELIDLVAYLDGLEGSQN